MLVDNNFKKEIENLKNLTIRELVANFGKTKSQAVELINKAEMDDALISNPLGLHDSSVDWALKVLTKNEDIAAIEKYFNRCRM